MLISRGASTLKLAKFLKAPNRKPIEFQRFSGDWGYRTLPSTPSKTIYAIAEAVQGVAWWWILWHLWTEPQHITGEFPYPDPSQWTDEELGIPKDEEIPKEEG